MALLTYSGKPIPGVFSGAEDHTVWAPAHSGKLPAESEFFGRDAGGSSAK